MYKVYEHVSPSGKRYIGITCQPLNRRWRNGNGYVRNTYFFRAIQKYGWNNFEHNVICECGTLQEANKAEIELIAIYHTNNPCYGYNISGGGDGGGRVAESTKRLLSAVKKGTFKGEDNPNYGRKHTQEERALMSQRQKEYFKTHHGVRYGCTRTAESRQKQSESRRSSEKAQAAILALNRSKAKPVRCVETGDVYPSTHEVKRLFGYEQGNIAAACRGKYKQAYGFHWEYV